MMRTQIIDLNVLQAVMICFEKTLAMLPARPATLSLLLMLPTQNSLTLPWVIQGALPPFSASHASKKNQKSFVRSGRAQSRILAFLVSVQSCPSPGPFGSHLSWCALALPWNNYCKYSFILLFCKLDSCHVKLEKLVQIYLSIYLSRRGKKFIWFWSPRLRLFPRARHILSFSYATFSFF